ncbi:SAGA histone acetylase and TREX-2 complexes component [Tulasnella sp. JGI-2019a]|nr:SAGA histone acetylase and TREX-2 complexes component [Tulasnella sp. JGI-2019a]
MPRTVQPKPKSAGGTVKATTSSGSIPSGPPISPGELETLQQNLVKRLIITGEWNRLSAILKDRLDESGWMDDVSNKAKEYALQQDPLHFKTLVQELTPNAEATVPADIKEEITSLLRTWIDENTEN